MDVPFLYAAAGQPHREPVVVVVAAVGELTSWDSFVEAARGYGIGRSIVDHLVAAARERGFGRVSIETGTMAAFAPARALYAGAGFQPCGPFADYRDSPHSCYMTLALDG